jgi:hypothetical protein
MLSNGAEFSGCDVAADAGASDGDAPVWWTFDAVQAALVDAHDLWRRSPRVGHRPLKSCWPNEMVQRIDGGDHDARGGDMVAPAPRPLPLSRAEVARRDAVSAWVAAYVPGDVNRRVVWLATAQMAGGRASVSWVMVQRRVRLERGRGALARRYERAIGAIVAALNYPDAAAMVVKGHGPKAISEALGLTFAEAHALSRQLKG